MTAEPKKTDRYRETVFLPKTDFPMKAGLPQKEPELLKRWADMDLYKILRDSSKGREKFVLHDGPPYANGNIHIGHALNKVLKDLVVRSAQMAGKDANYVPGWDCHGLPIEWKIEEQYRAKGQNKDAIPINEFRKECREFATHWVNVQREEFKRLGVEGDWDNPYLTMNFKAEAIISRELQKFAGDGQLYRGSKPVMWSVVEKTALAEAEVEYADVEVDTIFVKFPVRNGDGAKVVIWTTTPWTIPGNRAISFSSRINYGLYEVTDAPEGNWTLKGEKLVVADKLADDVFKAGRIIANRVSDFKLAGVSCDHPLKSLGYDFTVPLLDGDHVTDDAGTGFVHTAPSHGADDYNVWVANQKALRDRGIETDVPTPVDENGFYTKDAPGFDGGRVIDHHGRWGDANKRVIESLKTAGMLLGHNRRTISYPHSWRSKKPIIFRNTPQWFISMDKQGLRDKALAAIEQTEFFPPAGKNRLRGMIESRPDWVISRQRAWGVPITVFVNKKSGEILNDIKVNARIFEAFCEHGADAWYEEGAAQKLLGNEYKADDFEQVKDILDVWFDSGSTHAFVLEERPDLKWPADVYLEGSDQHRGWFHSSLLESCGTRGRAPYDALITHGFTMAEDGRKMSKSLGNTVVPQEVIKNSGADILRLWVATVDYSDDQRIGNEILKTTTETYRKLRNTFRYMLGALEGYQKYEHLNYAKMPELERYILHKLAEVGAEVQAAYKVYDYKRAVATLTNFMNVELSAFYFDIRKDTLYCDPFSSDKRRATRTLMHELFHCLTTWWAPVLVFTMEEVWLSRYAGEGSSVHLMQFAQAPSDWRDEALAEKWALIRKVRASVTGALEIERANKVIGSALEAAPEVFVSSEDNALAAVQSIDFAEVCITSAIAVKAGEGPQAAFRLSEAKNIAVVPHKAEGQKCARSWKISKDIGSDKDFPDITARDAEAVREWQTRTGKTV
ncbi:isoleucine--tRNA ligase [Aestuariivirga litoralis]|uniref:isoleucine--tRNA ligase n=1 Tax=Aestuariivirga litoralis TaxID=2650924 RepID=UPI0018C72C61|nr:isoleucine--tRNA ligase [Aestuariivirga litoralis]MBG1232098.1 isoleucine--tRNA ligase [Aestuariivirga litoralis]